MRFNRFALVAGVLALGVAACGDDVQLVEPTPPPPPPPPALSASMAPASAEVMVGSSVVFAVNVSGGVAGEASSWSCASSNTGIATVSVTSAGCQATGVAAGGVTITATVSKGNETANVGSQLTVTAPPPPPPFEASIAPESQSVAVGSSVVFAVNTSGGHVGMMMMDMMVAASWTCASSDPAIATVETTDAGCQATGVSGGDVTINVAATDGYDTVNLVAQLTVTTDPVTAFSATMSPEAAEVAIGSSAVFAINVTGGAADATASWECSSSDDAIATAETTDAGCQATGVAGGGVTINAAVTKGDDSANLASRLTVTAPDVGEPAFILLASITDEDDNTAPAALSGRISVQISVERGDQILEGLSLLVDGEAVAHQSFGIAASPGPAEQAVHEFTLSFDSDGYVVHGDHTDIDYLNGNHTISGELQIADGMMGQETISSNVVTVEFNNPDGFVVDADLGQTSMLDGEGRRWYGGPLNGHIEISALPVIYSGEEIGEVTISLAGCEAEEAEGDDHGNGDDHGHAAEASFDFDCEGEDAGRAITVAEGGNDGMILNADDLPDANIDMEGPAVAPYFDPNPNNRELGWVNRTVDFLGEQGSSNENGWLIYNDDGADDAGVGGYQPVLRYAEGDDIEDAIGAARLSLTNLPSESEMNAYCAVVSAVDKLGNESGLPDEDDGMCEMAGTLDTDATDDPTNDATGYEMLLEALAIANRLPADVAPVTTKADAVEAAQEALADAGLLVGVDITPPGIEIDEDERINDATALSLDFDVYDDEHDDHNSGLHSVAPLLVRIQRRTIDDTECLAIVDAAAGAAGTGTAGEVDNGDDVSCTADPAALADPTPITFSATPATSHAYYTLSGAALDQAGNHSMVESHTFVFDETVATATAPAAPGSLEAGESFQIASFLNDDLSIRDYYVTANFPDVGAITPISLGIVAPTVVDAFDAASLTHRNFSVTTDVETYAGLQEDAAATDVLELETVGVAVRDQADSDGTNDRTDSVALTVEDADDGFDATADPFTVEFTTSETRLCVADDVDDCDDSDATTDDDETETELEVVATATNLGAFSDPFERVDFWVRDVNGVSWMLGSDTFGDSGRVSSTDRHRTWTYSLDASAANLHMLTREAAFPPTSDADEYTLLAFGVNDDGVALVSEVAVDLEDGEATR